MSGDESTTDRHLLIGSAYAGDQPLAARQHLYAFQRPTYDLPGLVLDRLDSRAPGVVLDVGCGNGTYLLRLRSALPRWKVIGLDLSAGMLKSLDPPLVVADAAHLPFAADSVDVALAMHMLYHVEDVAAGVAELARVVAPSGRAFVSTNALTDKAELDDLWRRASGLVLGMSTPPQRISLSRRFPLEEAPKWLKRQFASVAVHPLPGTIRVTTPEPVIRHLGSYRAFAERSGVPFEETLLAAEELLAEHLAVHGVFEISTLGGILECRHAMVG